MAHQSVIMGSVLAFHELEHVIITIGVQVEGFGDLGGVAVYRKMVLNLVDDGTGKKQVFDIDLVFPGRTSQDDRLILIDQVVTDGPEVGEGAGNDLAGAPVQGHMEELGAVGGRKDEGFAGDERSGIFERRVAMFQSFGDHSIPFPGGDPVYLAAKFDTFGYAVDGDNAFSSVVKGSGDGGSGSKDVDDHYDRVVHII
jgi:hypothetical protein